MEINLYLLLSLLIALLVISYLLGKLHRVRGQLFLIRDALNDIKAGNLNRRVLTRESDLTKQICYDINEIAMSSQSRLIQQKQSEQAYKRLMTSLSHDVKTPLASLVGYLEAVESKMVTGAEQEEYIRVAMEKAHHLKDFVTALFEWVKLDAGEQIFHFEVCDLNELSRDIMADWVPLLENHDLSYEIEIPETEYMTRVDSTAYGSRSGRICAANGGSVWKNSPGKRLHLQGFSGALSGWAVCFPVRPCFRRNAFHIQAPGLWDILSRSPGRKEELCLNIMRSARRRQSGQRT